MKKIIIFLSLATIVLTGCNTVSKPDVIRNTGQPGGDSNECEEGYVWCEPIQECLEESEPCLGGGADPEPEPEPEDLPITDYPYGLFVEYTGANIGSIRGSERIPFGIDSHNKIVSPGGNFDIAGKVGVCNAHGTVNIKMGGNLEYTKSSKQWMFHLMLRPAINNYIWECGGTVMDNSMEEWDAPFIMPFDEGAVIEQPGLVFKMTLQDIPLWPVPLID
ncbi:hypothetical protein KKA33_00635 [Patescibacteria group bacterium]|nr:hypothetical protein [Patescibacteria group bacterium]